MIHIGGPNEISIPFDFQLIEIEYEIRVVHSLFYT